MHGLRIIPPTTTCQPRCLPSPAAKSRCWTMAHSMINAQYTSAPSHKGALLAVELGPKPVFRMRYQATASKTNYAPNCHLTTPMCFSRAGGMPCGIGGNPGMLPVGVSIHYLPPWRSPSHKRSPAAVCVGPPNAAFTCEGRGSLPSRTSSGATRCWAASCATRSYVGRRL